MTIQELKQKKQDFYTKAIESNGMFFAFDIKQFNEGLKVLKDKKLILDGEKITSIGAGGYIPSKNIEAFKIESKKIEDWYKNEVKAIKNGLESVILHELKNYECFYTSDISEAFDVLRPLGITKKQVLNVYSKHKDNN
ncbi:MAG: hypothetical protein EBR82_84605 [Caulobacteraceae bacterium]|nr:hypothetical protein [Caulobacteraceae bacterium]